MPQVTFILTFWPLQLEEYFLSQVCRAADSTDICKGLIAELLVKPDVAHEKFYLLKARIGMHASFALHFKA